MSFRTRVLVIVAITAGSLVVGMPQAWASHVVEWGIGSPGGPRETTTADAEPVAYEVLVSLGGEPLSGWPITVQVLDEARQALDTLSLATDGSGSGSFTIDPSSYPNEVIIVRLCDDDGCVYGESTVTQPAAPATTTTEATTTTTTTTTEVTTTTTEAATPSTLVAEEEDNDDDLTGLFVALIVIGILLILFGLWFWWWRRRFCDWSAYYDQGGNLIPLRKARGHECCVYTVRVRSTLDDFDFASKGRQAPDTLDGIEEAPEGRLRIFDTDHAFEGLDLYSWVSARSGPFGRLDWMQLDAAARTRLPEGAQPNDSYRWQLESHEEPPDVAIHLRYAETTTATIDLESSCPNHENTYTGAGKSTARLEANHECSNAEPGPECPVELTAMSYSGISVTGDLKYVVKAHAGSDTDELEGHAGLDVREVNGVTFYGSHVDSHDHPARPRVHYGEVLGDNDNRVVKGDNHKIIVRQAMELDAGSIVPARVWSTTEEVSADSFVDFDHDISVKAAMDPCKKKDCCGHGPCRCKPRLELVFRNERAWIECDGKSYPLGRNNLVTMLGMALGSNAPWQLG